MMTFCVKYLFLLALFLSSNLAFASCEIYLERANVVSNDFFELDISDSYNLEKPFKIKDKKNLIKILKLSEKLKAFNEYREEIRGIIQKNKIDVLKIKGDLGTLSSFLIKGSLSEDRYFSFILYSSCDLFKERSK